MNLVLHVDGGSRGNPGPGAAGVVIGDRDTGKTLHEGGYYLGVLTNNAAEYRGLLRGLETGIQIGGGSIKIHSDSQLMVRQVNGDYRVKSPDLKPLYEKARGLLSKYDDWEIVHVYRENNQRADELANMAMDVGRDQIVVSVLDTPGKDASGKDATNDDQRTMNPGTDHHDGWAIEIVNPPRPVCPAGSGDPRGSGGKRFSLTNVTPSGLCVYAMQSVLREVLGKTERVGGISGGTSGGTSGGRSRVIPCERCGVSIRITKGS